MAKNMLIVILGLFGLYLLWGPIPLERSNLIGLVLVSGIAWGAVFVAWWLIRSQKQRAQSGTDVHDDEGK